MKKKFSLEIKEPCHENSANMKSNPSGFFCDSCAKNVIDLSIKTNSEIGRFIAQNKNNTSICARLKTSQLEQEFEINETSKIQNFKYAAAIAATVLLTSPILAQEKNPPTTEINCPKPNPVVMGKIAYVKPVDSVISIIIEGNILDEKSKKIISEKKFPNMSLYITGANNAVQVDAKTGRFSIPVLINSNTKEIYLSLSSGDYQFSKTIAIDTKTIKNNVVKKTIYVNESEFSKLMILGGLGINYIDNKKIKLI